MLKLLPQVKISKAIVAHLLAIPLVAAATVAQSWLVTHFPGLPDFTKQQIADESYVSALAFAGVGLHYLKGAREWQKLEAEGVILDEDPAASGQKKLVATRPSGAVQTGV